MATYTAVYRSVFGFKRCAGMTTAESKEEAVEHFENQREDDPDDKGLQEWHNCGQQVEVEPTDGN